MLFKVVDDLNNNLNKSINSNMHFYKGKISPEGIKKLNDDLNDEIIGEPVDELDETLDEYI